MSGTQATTQGWMTYDSLVDDVTNYVERSDDSSVDPAFAEQLPRLILMAQRRITQDLKIQGQETVVLGLLTAGICIYQKPDRWRGTIGMQLFNNSVSVVSTDVRDTQLPQVRVTQAAQLRVIESAQLNATPTSVVAGPVYQRAKEYLDVWWPDRTQLARPRFYGEYDRTHILISPTPDQNYPLEWIYYALPVELSSKVQQNWLTWEVPNLLLYATLVECAPFLREDERIPVWQGNYQSIRDALNTEDVSKMLDRANERSKS